MASPSYEQLRETAIAHVRAYENPNPFHNPSIQQHRDPGSVHFLHPVDSIPAAFSGPITDTKFADAMHFFGSVIEHLAFEIQDTVVDVETRTVVVRLRATFDFKAFGDEPEENNYMADYMWLTEMDEKGKIVRVEEFLDAQRLMGYVQPKAERYLAHTSR